MKGMTNSEFRHYVVDENGAVAGFRLKGDASRYAIRKVEQAEDPMALWVVTADEWARRERPADKRVANFIDEATLATIAAVPSPVPARR